MQLKIKEMDHIVAEKELKLSWAAKRLYGTACETAQGRLSGTQYWQEHAFRADLAGKRLFWAHDCCRKSTLKFHSFFSQTHKASVLLYEVCWTKTVKNDTAHKWSITMVCFAEKDDTALEKKKNIGFSWSCFSRQNSNAADAIKRTAMDGGGRWKWSQKESGKLWMKVPTTAHLIHDRHSHGIQSNLWQEFNEHIVSCQGITDNVQRPTQEPTYVIHRLRSSLTSGAGHNSPSR